MNEEREEMSTEEQVQWYLAKLSEKDKKAVLLYAFRKYLNVKT